MAYTTNTRIKEVREEAQKLTAKGWSTRRVARRLGYCQSTIVRWTHRKTAATLSSAPRAHPKMLSDELVARIIAKRLEARRCAIVVHALLKKDGVTVSLSSVKRVIKRYCAPLKRKSAWARKRKYLPRPEAAHAGALVQMDTIHFGDVRGPRTYVYTALDVYSRYGFAWRVGHINTLQTIQFLKKTRAYFPFKIECIQTDNGPEFGKWFTDHVVRKGMQHRHNHPRSPNENGHLERFNRTIQEEMPKYGFCFQVPSDIPLFIDWYNTERPHLALNCKTPSEMLKVIPRS